MDYAIKKLTIAIFISIVIALGIIPYTHWIGRTFPMTELNLDFILLILILNTIYVSSTVIPSAIIFGYICYRTEEKQQ